MIPVKSVGFQLGVTGSYGRVILLLNVKIIVVIPSTSLVIISQYVYFIGFSVVSCHGNPNTVTMVTVMVVTCKRNTIHKKILYKKLDIVAMQSTIFCKQLLERVVNEKQILCHKICAWFCTEDASFKYSS